MPLYRSLEVLKMKQK